MKNQTKLMGDGSITGDFQRFQEIYARLASDRNIFLAEDITKATGSSLAALLLNYNAQDPKKEIKLFINSNGGDASALSNIYDVMKMISAPVHTYCIGKAYSAAAILLAAGAKGCRFATKHSDIMIHGIQAAFPMSEGSDRITSEIEMKMLQDHNDMLMGILAKHVKKKPAQVSKDCERDLFMDAKEALAYGMIDQIL